MLKAIFSQLFKSSKKEFLDKETVTTTAPQSDLASLLALSCSSRLIAKNRKIIAEPLQTKITQLPYHKLNKLDQDFRKHIDTSIPNHDKASLLNILENEDNQSLLLLCATMWPDGHIREFALNKIINDGSVLALKLKLLRLNDWVPAVYLAAKSKLLNHLSNITVDTAVQLTPYLVNLSKSCRSLKKDFHVELCKQVLDKLDSNTIHKTLTSNNIESKERRAMAEILWISDLKDSHNVLNALLTTPDSYIRFYTLKKIIPELPINTQENLVLDLPNTNWGPAKIERLRILERIHSPKLKDQLIKALSDSSRAARQFAQHYLAKENFDFTTHYLNLLETATIKIASNALYGLSTVNPHVASPIVKNWLYSGFDHKKITALYLISHLVPEEHVSVIYDSLIEPSNQMKRAAYYAALRLNDRSLFWSIVNNSENSLKSQIYAAKLLLSDERWKSFNIALKLLSHHKKQVQSLAKHSIKQFSNNLFQSWTHPSSALTREISDQLSKENLNLEPITLSKLRFELEAFLNS